MTEEQLREIVKSVRFFTQRKETYTYEDIIQLEDQLKNKIAADLGKTVVKEFDEVAHKLTELDGTVKTKETKLTEFEKAVADAKARAADLESKYSEAQKAVTAFETKEEKRVATDLLKGMVFGGAEFKVYNELGDAIKNVKFDEGATLEEKQAQIKPLVDGIIETQPYFAFTGEKKKVITDNQGLVIKKKVVAEEDKSIIDELSGDSTTVAVNGLVL